MKTTIYLLSVAALVLAGCSLKWVSPDTYALRGLGEPRCPQTSSTGTAECVAQKKQYHEEYDALQKQRALSLKDALKDDMLCYKNPRPGEKACATTEPTGK
jgi:hypothetical protein